MAVRKKQQKALPAPAEDSVTVHQHAGLLQIAGMPDRIWYSCGLTIQPRKFESVKIDLGYATDVRGNETIHQALGRAYTLVQDEVAAQGSQIRKGSEVPSSGRTSPKKTVKKRGY